MTVQRANDVAFVYEWENPNDDEAEPIDIDVKAHITPYYPAVRYLRNGDPGFPAEGGEVEDLEATWPDGSSVDLDKIFGHARAWDFKAGSMKDVIKPLSQILEDMAHDESFN